MVSGAGPVVLLGSGETSASLRAAYAWVFRQFAAPVQVAVLETPAGFEQNSRLVAARVGTFVEKHLVNHKPQIDTVPARRRGTEFSPDNPEILEPLWRADVVFAGPGSPTYAVRQLRDSLAWEIVRARHRLGAGLMLSSAATIAAGSFALPVYEMYKVGEDPYWKPGLDLLADFGLHATFVPHWNNQDGGSDLDTSRCFMGAARFAELVQMLPTAAHTLIGIDELTALCLDFAAEEAHVIGIGSVTVLRGGHVEVYASGAHMHLHALGEMHAPVGGAGIRDEVWQAARGISAPEADQPVDVQEPPPAIRALLAARDEARLARDWARSDTLRDQLRDLGWDVQDTPQGQMVSLRAE